MAFKFNDPAVAEKYESDQTADPLVHLPGGKNGNGWKGKLSDIPLEQADRWISRPGQNLLKLKPPSPQPKRNDGEKGKEK